MAGLCVEALEQHVEPGYVKMLIKKRRLLPETPPIEVESWALPLGKGLKSRLTRQICDLSDSLCEQGRYKQAMTCLKKGLELYELVEGLYQRLITRHQGLGQHVLQL